MDEELDFFVRDCYAEPGNGALGASEEKLQLIAEGLKIWKIYFLIMKIKKFFIFS